VQIWGDMLEPGTAPADKLSRHDRRRGDIRYEFRYFRSIKAATRRIGRTVFPMGAARSRPPRPRASSDGIRAGAGPEAAGRGQRGVLEDARLDHGAPEGVSDRRAPRRRAGHGPEPDALLAKMGSQEVANIIATNANWVPRQDPEIPRIFVNGKVISRWNIPNQSSWSG